MHCGRHFWCKVMSSGLFKIWLDFCVCKKWCFENSENSQPTIVTVEIFKMNLYIHCIKKWFKNRKQTIYLFATSETAWETKQYISKNKNSSFVLNVYFHTARGALPVVSTFREKQCCEYTYKFALRVLCKLQTCWEKSLPGRIYGNVHVIEFYGGNRFLLGFFSVNTVFSFLGVLKKGVLYQAIEIKKLLLFKALRGEKNTL